MTGGAHGIGREYCRAFAAVGARVVVADVDGAGADSVAQEIGGTDIAVVRADVSDEASVTSLADTAIRRLGRVDVLVNNAAVYATVPVRRAPIGDLTVREWDQVMATNLRGVFLCTRAVVPNMKEHGTGRIINIASGTAFGGTGEQSGFIKQIYG